MVALVLAPARASLIGYLWGLPALIAIGIAIFARGEPSDQTAVHQPELSETHLPKLSQRQFDALEDRVERLAQDPPQADRRISRQTRHARVSRPVTDEAEFTELVRQAIDELPPRFAHALDHVGVVVSDQRSVQRINGRLQPLYGLYIGYAGRGSIIGAPASGAPPDRIVIFRDTLVHDYGNDPRRLEAQVTRTLRHELAHHLGWDEKGVRALGL